MVLIGELRRGDTVEVDGSPWTVARIERGDGVYSNPARVSVKLVHEDSEFLTGGWQSSPVSELGLTTPNHSCKDWTIRLAPARASAKV